MPACETVDESFLTSAPTRFEHEWAIARPAAEVWAEVAGERPLHWCRGLDIRWTCPEPRGVGATRDARILGAAKAQERFFAWEEGRRHAFHLTSVNVPVFRALAEEFTVEAQGEQRCTFRWRIGIRPTALGKPGGPLNALLFKRLFADTSRYFQTT